MSLNKPLLALMMISSATFAGRAFASTPSNCTIDSDCAHGYTCQSTFVATPPKATCAPDETCATSGAGAATGSDSDTSVSVTISTCEPAPCASDSDCGSDMVCHTETSTACSGGTAPACPANTKCDLPAVDVTPPTCTTTTSSMCTFRWQLPCSADADCGSGFVCHPSVYGACSGGSSAPTGTGNVGGEIAPTPAPDNCTTTTKFPGWCQATATTCATDTDCPSNWICQDGSVGRGVPVSTTGSGTSGGGGAGGSAESGAGVSGSATATDVGTISTAKTCVSPVIAPFGSKDDGTGARTGGSDTTGSSPNGSGATSGTQGGGTGPIAPATETDGVTAGHDSKTLGASPDGAGCSVNPASPFSGSGAAALLTLFGLGLVAVRRRRG
jgi:MYXO-CTERM domain-containing protein